MSRFVAPDPAVPLVELDRVGLEIPGPVPTRILHPMSLRFPPGLAVAVVGPSGAGKSSLASIIGALQPPSEGSYRFAGQPISGTDPASRARFRRDHIGFVFQEAHLIDERTALQNVALGIVDAASDMESTFVRSRSALAAVGLSNLAQRRAALLSGGERQRVALARAIVKEPELVIADEPTGALDLANSRAVLDLLFSLDTTVLIVTHDAAAARRADRTLIIVDGYLQ